MDILNEALLKLKRLENEIERMKTIEQPVTAIGGWLEIPNGSWSYASTTTINVPSGAASIYAVGDQIRLKQGGAYKYFYVTAIADTLLTVTGGSDYSVANAAITDAAFSKGGGVGYPIWFNWTPTFTGFSVDPSDIIAQFMLIGKNIFVRVDMDTAGTSNANNFHVSAPLAVASDSRTPISAVPFYVDNGTTYWGKGSVFMDNGASVFRVSTDSGPSGWTTSGSKRAVFEIFYPIA